jgi:protease-4
MGKTGTISALSTILALATGGCITLDLYGGTREMEERVVEDNHADAKVAVIDVVGTMMIDRSTSRFPFAGMADNIIGRTKEQLDRAADDEEVKAVVVRISSPGGQVYPSLEISRELTRFRQESNKPVIAYVPDVAASGGYLAAMGADEIVADRSALTGSIGVLLVLPEVGGLLDWMRVKVNVLKAGDRKDVGSPFREMTQQDRAELMQLAEYYHTEFKRLVQAGRSDLTEEQIETVADGRVFTAPDAMKHGLVDAVGDLAAAHKRAAERAGLAAESTNLVMYRRPGEYGNSIYTMAPPHTGGVQIHLGVEALTPRPQFLYLWHPGL